jgi:ribokinase
MRLETILAWIDFLETKPHIFVSVDILPYPLQGNLDDPRLLKLLRRVDAFMPSEAEAESLLPAHEPQSFCRQIAARGPRIVVIKQGDHGAIVFDRDKDLFMPIAPYPAIVADLTGAGDSFCGGFAVGLAETGDVRQAAYYGTVSASYIIEGFGGLHALAIRPEQATARRAELDRLNRS